MQPAHYILIAAGLLLAAGGVVLLFRGAARSSGDGMPPRPYIPLGVIAVGLVIAYHTYSDFATLGPDDITLMFLFAFALVTLLGLRFFIVDRLNLDDQRMPSSGAGNEARPEYDDSSSGSSGSSNSGGKPADGDHTQ